MASKTTTVSDGAPECVNIIYSNTARGVFSLEHLQSHMKSYFRDMPALTEVKVEYL